MAPRAVALTAFMLVGAQIAGIVGALVGQGLATLLVYPLVVAAGVAIWGLGRAPRRALRGALARVSVASGSGCTGAPLAR